MAKFTGKHTTTQGTYIKMFSEPVVPSKNYQLSQAIVISTNEIPNQYQYDDAPLFGWFRTIEDILPYYDENSNVYQLVKGMTMQTGDNNVVLQTSSFKFAILYTEGTNASASYLTTTDLVERLSNFNPTNEASILKFVLSISIDGVKETKEMIVYKPIYTEGQEEKALQKIATLLNNSGFSCSFFVEDNNIKIVHPRFGDDKTISVVATTKDGYIDIAGTDYLNIIGAQQINGEYDTGNDFTSYVEKLITLGFKPTLFTSTAIIGADKIKQIEDNLITLSGKDGVCSYMPFVYVMQSPDENIAYNQLLPNSLSVFARTPCMGFCDDKLRLQIQGGNVSSVASKDYGSNNDGMRHDPEWGMLNCDNDLLSTYQGLNNQQVNKLKAEGVGGVIFYNDYYNKLMVMGNDKGWSLVEGCAYSCLAEEVMVAIENNMILTSDKTKSLSAITDIKLAIANVCNTFRNNKYLTNEPDTNDPIWNTLPKNIQDDLTTLGYSIYDVIIKDNSVSFKMYSVLLGIISSINVSNKVLSN